MFHMNELHPKQSSNLQSFQGMGIFYPSNKNTAKRITFSTTKTQTTPNTARRTTSKTPRNHHHFLKLTLEIYFCTNIPSPKTYVQWNFICIRRKNRFPLIHYSSISPHHTHNPSIILPTWHKSKCNI
jgi:hypothetical protein